MRLRASGAAHAARRPLHLAQAGGTSSAAAGGTLRAECVNGCEPIAVDPVHGRSWSRTVNVTEPDGDVAQFWFAGNGHRQTEDCSVSTFDGKHWTTWLESHCRELDWSRIEKDPGFLAGRNNDDKWKIPGENRVLVVSGAMSDPYRNHGVWDADAMKWSYITTDETQPLPDPID